MVGLITGDNKAGIYMANKHDQINKIEEIRARLEKLVVEKNFDMKDQAVISLSDELDSLIVDFSKYQQSEDNDSQFVDS